MPIPLHHDLKTARGLLLGRTSENSVRAKFALSHRPAPDRVLCI